MTPTCIRCKQPIPLGKVAEPVMTGRGKDENLVLLGMRAQHPVDVAGTGCQVMDDHYRPTPDDGYLRYLLEQAEAHPFPPYRKWRTEQPA